ncbi:MAG: DUF2339 domain-containing protein [Opitutaceae bacterium]
MVEFIIGLLVLALVLFPIWSIVKILSLGSANEMWARRIKALEQELAVLREKIRREGTAAETEQPVQSQPITPAPPIASPPYVSPVIVQTPSVIAQAAEPERSTPPLTNEVPAFLSPLKPDDPVLPPPLQPAFRTPPPIPGSPIPPVLTDPATPPPPPIHWPEPTPAFSREPSPPPPRESLLSRINWEQFMGAQLFAWLGGLAALLGVAFFVKYSFDHGWISPQLRVAIGFVFGACLMVGGVFLTRKGFTTPAQTLVGTGVVSLYLVTFACRSIYAFEFFGTIPTLLVMTLITVTAFVLAVRLQAQVIAILGILGGFLTPKLLSTGVDNPLGLFGYLTLLNIGLAAVALHRRWFYLVSLGAAGTVITMAGWAHLFYTSEKTVTAMTVNLEFTLLFIGVTEAARRLNRSSPLLIQTALVLPAVAFGFAWHFLNFPSVAARTTLFFGYVFLVSVGFFFLAWREKRGGLVACAAGATTILLVRWASQAFTGVQTPAAMTVCLGFCGVYLGFYFFARRRDLPIVPIFWSAVILPVVAFGFAWFFLGYSEVANRTGLFFGFVFLVSLFLFALAWFEEMGRLVVGAAGITALLMMRWAGNTFQAQHTPVVVTVCLVFSAIYFLVYLLARRFERATPSVLWAAVGMPFVALGFAFALMNHAAVGASPALLFGFILASDGFLLALAWLDARLTKLHLAAGLTVFALLSFWTTDHLTANLLPWALAMFLVFAALHTVLPLLLQKKRPAAAPTWWSQLFPPLTLLLMLLPIFKLDSVSFLLWPAILLVDLIAIGLALLSLSLAAVAAVLVLTLVATALCIFRVPETVAFQPSLLLVIGGFAVFFFAASLWLARKLGEKLPAASSRLNAIFGDARAQLPAFASLLPFLLLIMVCARLAVPNPSAIFGLGLLLVILTLGLTRLLVIEWLPACALAGIAALELTWHTRHFDRSAAGVPLGWYLVFYAVFALYPFLFRRQFARLAGPWIVAAASGLAHFWVVYQAIKLGWPNDFLGAVPALFALAPLGGLIFVLRTTTADNPKRLTQLAWFGGVALFFITLIFPIQFDRQWLTVAWALEGAALLWLFHRVPHAGLRATGVVLLVTAFARLALNPAVLGYHVRGDTGILNWYLYAYGVTTVALFAAATLLASPRNRVFGINTPPLLNTLGAVLAFLLLNIEIADYFTTPGARSLAFRFSGHFARDMTYTIAWALFALALLGAGIWRKTRAARYAAIVLLSVALLKLFFHDLARLEALYRIGALFGVAVVAILASFAYQRFLPSNEKSVPPTLP